MKNTKKCAVFTKEVCWKLEEVDILWPCSFVPTLKLRKKEIRMRHGAYVSCRRAATCVAARRVQSRKQKRDQGRQGTMS